MTESAPGLRAHNVGPICRITIDNPTRLNAFTFEMWASVPRLLAKAAADPQTRAIVITGAGTKAFSAGADISEFGSNRTGDAAKRYDEVNHAAYEALLNCPTPTIAMVRGYCFGGACELAVCCDFRIVSEDATFSVPSAKLSLGYNPRWVKPMLSVMSAAKVKEMLFTGRRYSATQALAMGLANTVAAADALEAETEKLAAEIAANAPLSIRAAKAAVDELTNRPESPDWGRLDRLVDDCFQSQDFVEGQRAFMEKRKPRFSGR